MKDKFYKIVMPSKYKTISIGKYKKLKDKKGYSVSDWDKYEDEEFTDTCDCCGTESTMSIKVKAKGAKPTKYRKAIEYHEPLYIPNWS